MKYGRIFFIYNPASGKGRVKRALPQIIAEISKHCDGYAVEESSSEKDFSEKLRNACGKFDCVIFSGGDGTFNMAVNAVAGLNDLPVFGYLPSGTTCDMAYNLGLSKKIDKAIKQIFNAETIEYDVGKVDDKRFIYVVNSGSCTQAVYETPEKLKKKLGKLAYALHIAANLKSSFIVNEINVNGTTYFTPLLLISNSREIASFKVNPDFSPSNGKYYAVIVKNGKLRGIENMVYFFLHGVKKSVKKGKIDYLECSDFAVDSQTKWSADGELLELNGITDIGFSGEKLKILSLKK